MKLRSIALGLFVLVASSQAYADDGWRLDEVDHGVRVEKRDVQGSHFNELRITTTSAAPLDALCNAIYPKVADLRPEGRFKRRELLRETPTDRWTYEQISVPVVSDRDYVMHARLDQAASTGRCEVTFQTENDPSRPPASGFVQIPIIRGHWTLVPLSDGQVSIEYRIFSEPGGGVPAFLARGGQKDAAVDFMRTILARAGAAPGR